MNENATPCALCGAPSVLELLNDDGTSQPVCRACALREDAELVAALDGAHGPGCPGAPVSGSSSEGSAAEREVREAIELAVQFAGGDAQAALETVRSWTRDGGLPRHLLVAEALRDHLGQTPSAKLEAILAEAAGASAGDESLERRLATEALEDPATGDEIRQELDAATQEPLRAWVKAEAWRWREARSA